ncbi:NAD-dependent epimerase/dehydratase family protein [Flavobacterium sp. RSP15]|uniref:NAD-dependent epimerase/dehydratase family protein n=1 Tax=Flavobacterium sp. RSP15 TaxID=2497485 RepID=UPI000F81DB7E|nr:NAD-dependent epimerase/dehydratase [Flavobacterium sp. RSP15]RTY86023.1 NAD-dependent epimerase/dehydratase family protein [Flavobacterium sp. RSP15]
MSTILLTGATGFLGSHLLESFIKQGLDVIVLKRTTSDTWRINHLLDKVKIYNIDKVDFKTVFSDEKVDVVINTVCSYGRTNESLIDIINSNLIFGLNLLNEAIKNNVQTFINTDSLLPRNLNDYSLSKAQFADWLSQRSEKIQVINFKIEQMYGPKDDTNKFLPWLMNEMIAKTDDINLTSGIQKRDFIYITDVVAAYDLVLQKTMSLPKWSQFDIGTNIFTEVKEFVLILAGEVEKLNKSKIAYKLKFGKIPYRKGDVMIPELDNTKLIGLGWKPKVTIIEGIQKILKD